MENVPEDIYTEAEPDVDTLANLGPLAAMAGIWTGTRGLDVSAEGRRPREEGLHRDLRTAAHRCAGQRAATPLRPALSHAYPQAGRSRDLSRPGRLLAVGTDDGHGVAHAVDSAGAGGDGHRSRRSRREDIHAGGRPRVRSRTASSPARSSNTRSGPRRYTITVTINADGTWSYEQDTVLIIPGQTEPFHHTDRNTLRKIGEPTPNPTALAAAKEKGA